jgi:hypothetical protein
MKTIQYFLISILLFICSAISYGQNHLQLGDDCFKKGDYKCAADNYYKARAKATNAEIGKQKQDMAVACYQILAEANAEFGIKNYVQAKTKYQELVSKNPNDANAKEQVNVCVQKIQELENIKQTEAIAESARQIQYQKIQEERKEERKKELAKQQQIIADEADKQQQEQERLANIEKNKEQEELKLLQKEKENKLAKIKYIESTYLFSKEDEYVKEYIKKSGAYYVDYFIGITNLDIDRLKFNERGVILVQKKNTDKYGYINKNGDEVIPCIYDHIYEDYQDKKNSRIIVTLKGKYGILSLNNNVIIPCMYEYITPLTFIDGLFKAKLNDKYGIIDMSNNIVVDFQYSDLDNYFGYSSERYIKTTVHGGKKGGHFQGVIDITGNTIIPPNTYDYVVFSNFDTDYAYRSGDDVNICSKFEDSIFFAKKRETILWDIIDNSGNIIISVKQPKTINYCNILRINGNTLFDLTQKKEVITIKDRNFVIEDYTIYVIVAKRDILKTKVNFYNYKGELLISCDSYDNSQGYMRLYKSTGWKISQKGKYGFVTRYGQVIPCIYDKLYDDSHTNREENKFVYNFKVEKDGETYHIDISGNRW